MEYLEKLRDTKGLAFQKVTLYKDDEFPIFGKLASRKPKKGAKPRVYISQSTKGRDGKGLFAAKVIHRNFCLCEYTGEVVEAVCSARN